MAHPHPLYGGTLHNPVVFHTDRELNRAGFSTLRFNFRGVGASDGTYDDGRGEVEDVGAAVSWLRAAAPELPLVVVGYSFGSWCGIRWALRDPGVAAVVAIGLPVRIYGFDEMAGFDRPLAVVQGSEDELGSPGEVRQLLSRLDLEGLVHVVPGASHLFSGTATLAAASVVAAAQACLQGSGGRQWGSGEDD